MAGTTPNENSTHLNEAIVLISRTTIVTLLFTFSFILYCLCARLSYSQLQSPNVNLRKVLTFAFATVVIICATMDAALWNQYARIIFVDYSSLPGGPLGAAAQEHVSTIRHIASVPDSIGQYLALGVLLWRVWVVYSGTRFAIPMTILASLFYLGYLVSCILQSVYTWSPQASTEFPVTDRTLDIVFETSLSWSAASAIAMALMIATRLILVRRNHIKVMGKTDMAAQYLGVAAMLIESYALSTAWNIGYFISYNVRNAPSHNFFAAASQQAEFLSYFLVLYRVFSGRAWDQRTQETLSTMQFNERGHGHGGGGTRTVHDVSGMGVVTNLREGEIEAKTPTFPSCHTEV